MLGALVLSVVSCPRRSDGAPDGTHPVRYVVFEIEKLPFVFDPPRMQRRLTPSLPTRLCSAMSPISLGGPAPVFQTQAKLARSLAVSETSTDGVVDPWWSYARLIRSD
jgi:hypothetical protein